MLEERDLQVEGEGGDPHYRLWAWEEAKAKGATEPAKEAAKAAKKNQKKPPKKQTA